MTDLDRAHDKLIAVRAATDTDARFDALYQAVCRMWDHLEAQPTTTADYDPTAMDQAREHLAPEAEAGQGDGDEAVRAAAVRAVSTALHLDACTDDAHDGCDTGDWTREAETAIAAAEPHIRADEITRQASTLLTQAVQAAQEVASAPQTAPEAEAGQGDGDEAVRAAMAVLCGEGADSEGGWHSWRCFDRERYPEPCDCTEQVARAAIAAAEPHIRAEAWDEAATEARDLGWLHDDAHADLVVRNPYRQEQP